MLELGGAVVSVLDRLDREDVRLLPLCRVIASAVGLRWVHRQYSPLVAMHHMILRVRRKFFEITTKPNRLSSSLDLWIYPRSSSAARLVTTRRWLRD